MKRRPKILAFSGSSRKGSHNTRLLVTASGAVKAAGADVTSVDLRALALPIYDADMESDHGMPQSVQLLRKQMLAHDGFLIASPEHNGSVTALLKNALDWCSRPHGGVDGLAAYRGKTVALVAASVSPFGGVRGLIALRSIMAKMGAIVLPEDIALPFAQDAYDDSNALKNAGTQQALKSLAGSFVQLTYALHVCPTPQDGSA